MDDSHDLGKGRFQVGKIQPAFAAHDRSEKLLRSLSWASARVCRRQTPYLERFVVGDAHYETSPEMGQIYRSQSWPKFVRQMATSIP